MRLNIWTPGSRSASEIAAYATEQAEALAAHVSVALVSESESETPPDADLDLYHLGDSAEFAFAYRAALRRPGVVLLHHWSLHRLVRSETVERGDAAAYVREMRRAHGEAGAFVATQVARGLMGGLWPALYPLNDRILGASLGVVALTPAVTARVRLRVRDLPAMELPRHLTPGIDSLPTRAEARRTLGLPESAFVVAAPGIAMGPAQFDLVRGVMARLRERYRRIVLVADVSLRHLAAADAVLALHFPDDGRMPGEAITALGLGKPVFMTGGTAAGEAFPEGVVLRVDPGQDCDASLEIQLSRLVEDAALCGSLGRTARAHALAHHRLADTARALAGFLRDILKDRARLNRAAASRCPAEGSLDERLLDEARAAAHQLGLGGLSLGIEGLLAR